MRHLMATYEPQVSARVRQDIVYDTHRYAFAAAPSIRALVNLSEASLAKHTATILRKLYFPRDILNVPIR